MEHSPFENYNLTLFPRLARVGRAVASVVYMLPETPLSRGDHPAHVVEVVVD